MITWVLTVTLGLLSGPSAAPSWRPPELAVARDRQVARFEELEKIAYKYLGRPYRMGGTGRPGIDCSGFTCRVFAEAGYGIPRVSRDQVRAGKRVPLNRIQPGDLLFFVARPGSRRISHVGIYLGDRRMIHASSGEGRVTVSNLDRRWYRGRLVAARRVLSTAEAARFAASEQEIPPLEMVEHTAETFLPPTLRLTSRTPRASLGPELAGRGEGSALSLRAAILTEEGELGLTLAPELLFAIAEYALRIELAVPIRFPFGGPVTLGSLERAIDYTRFLRHFALGLPGAELELRLSRLGEVTLGAASLVDHLAPAVAASGVPGLSIVRSPLTAYFAYRGATAGLEFLLDDVWAPGLMGVGFRRGVASRVEAGLVLVSDQRGRAGPGDQAALRAVNGAEFEAGYKSRGVLQGLGAVFSLLRAGGRPGGAAQAKIVLGTRFADSNLLRLDLRGGWLGGHFLDGVFGPTYPVERGAHFAALEQLPGRFGLSSEVALKVGSFALGLGFGDAFGEARTPLDRRTSLLVALEQWPIGTRLFLDLRLAYAARALWTRLAERLDVLHGSARLAFASWCALELYLEKGRDFRGGAGLSLAWAP